MNSYSNIIIGSGPSGLQLGYYFEKYNINYVILEKNSISGSFFDNYPHSGELISINKVFTSNDNPDFNLRHDWNSLLNDDEFLFKEYSKKFYPNKEDLVKYLNDFAIKFKLNIKYNTNIVNINKYNNNFILKDDNDNIYKCNKLIIATGLNKNNYPEFTYIDPNISNDKIKHYMDFPKNFFKQKDNLKKYENKKVMIVGKGNSSFELANILNEYCSSLFIIGNNNNKEIIENSSIVTKYTGSLRAKYFGFLDTFYLKSLNAIPSDHNITPKNIVLFNYNSNISWTWNRNITKNSRIFNSFINKLKKEFENEDSYTHTNYYQIILCTGTSFDNTIFNFDIEKVFNNKFPKIKNNYESTNVNNLYFIGSLMHSQDFKQSSGGFIHGFRYLIKLFMNINFDIPYNIKIFNYNNDLKLLYSDITKYIQNRVNTSSSLYQMHGVLCDFYFYNENTKKIYYYHDIKPDIIDSIIYKYKIVSYTIIQFKFGKIDNFDIRQLNTFSEKLPKLLHIEFKFIYLDERTNSDNILGEDLFSYFTSDKFFHQIYNSVKMSPLIL